MAYVGTPRYLGSDQATLASIIYGEAGNQGTTGMQAVGAVIANRANSNLNGYGGDIMSQALAPNQFQGQSSNYNVTAWNVAGNVLNGTNPDPTGGALYYANPGASSAGWARNLNSSNSLQIGDHFFTDNTNGTPFTPNVTGSGSTIANGTPDASFGGNGNSVTAGGAYDPYSGDYTTTYTDPNTAFSTGSSGATSGAASGATPSTSASSSSTAGDVGQGAPVTQGLQQGTISAVTSWINNIESAFGGGLKSALTAAETGLGTAFSGIENWFVRFGLILLAIILIAIGLMVLLWDHGGKETAGRMVEMAAA